MASNPSGQSLEAQRQSFYADLQQQNLAPLWEVLHSLVTPEPASVGEAARWRYHDVRSKLARAGELISTEEAERRVLVLENPALPGQARATSSLYAGLQLLLPGETARCHRHTQCALRFVMEGRGAFTAVDGEKVLMEPWDLILTPNWAWHDHGNDGDEPVVWLDGLDIPIVTFFDASFAERTESLRHPETRPTGNVQKRWGANLRPVQRDGLRDSQRSPLFAFPYAIWRAALTAATGDRPDPHDGYRLEFNNPATGSSVMPTISAFCQLIPRGFETRPIRSTEGIVLVVVEGSGEMQAGTLRYDLTPGDIVAVPAWKTRRIKADTELVLFSYSDHAAQQRLALWREQLL